MKERCQICRRRLGNTPDTEDCGGDCLRCLAEAGDPDAIAKMRLYEPNNDEWVEDEEDRDS
jgi:hypothetical protein